MRINILYFSKSQILLPKWKKLFLLSIFLTISFQIFPDVSDKRLDSLLISLQELNKDNEKISIYNELSELYQKIYLSELAYNYANKALPYLTSTTPNKEKARTYFNLANASFSLSKFNYSIKYFQNAIFYFRQDNNYTKIISCLKGIGGVYKNLGETGKSMESYHKALKLSELTKNNKEVITCYHTLISIYLDLEDYNTALKYIIKSKEFIHSNADISLNYYPYSLQHEGNYYNKLHKNLKALELYNLSLEEFKKINDDIGIATIYAQLGDFYCDANKLDLSLMNYRKALSIHILNNNKVAMGILFTNISHVYSLKKNHTLALEYNIKALDIRKITGQKELIASSYTNIGSSLLAMKKYHKALPYLEKGLALAQELGIKRYISNSSNKIYNLYLQKGNYRKALEYHKILSDIKIKIIKAENNSRIAEIEIRYDNEKKQQELESLARENAIQKLTLKKRQNVVYGLFFSFFALGAFTFLFYRHNKLKGSQKNIELEQKLLRSQMNPHFIFNSLTSIQSFILKNDLKEAGKYLTSFAKLIRLVLVNSREEFVSLENEILTIRLYLSLQKVRFEDKFDYQIEIDPTLSSDSLLIAPMLAQPFIENSIEHGIMGLERKGHVTIRILSSKDQIKIDIEDDGVGRKISSERRHASRPLHHSLATKITEERIGILNKKHNLKITLNIFDLKDINGNPSGTMVSLNFPFIPENKHATKIS